MFLIPVSGWLMASSSPLQEAFGIQNMVFGWFAMPDPFVPGNADLSKLFGEIHEICTNGLMILLSLHAAAALKHHFIKKDTILRRMIRG